MAILGLDVRDDLGAVLFQCDLEDASACERNAQGRQHDEFGTIGTDTDSQRSSLAQNKSRDLFAGGNVGVRRLANLAGAVIWVAVVRH